VAVTSAVALLRTFINKVELFVGKVHALDLDSQVRHAQDNKTKDELDCGKAVQIILDDGLLLVKDYGLAWREISSPLGLLQREYLHGYWCLARPHHKWCFTD